MKYDELTAALFAEYGQVLQRVTWDIEEADEIVRLHLNLHDGRALGIVLARWEMSLADDPAVLLAERVREALKPVIAQRLRPHPEVAQADLSEYVIGYRSWRALRVPALDGDPFKLGAIGSGTHVWEGANEVLATCAPHRHPAPQPKCDCGLYAWHAPHKLVKTGGLRRSDFVYGAVRARGRIEVHRDGFRAQYAQPIVLMYMEDNEGMRDAAQRVGASLGLPVVGASAIEAFCSEHGKPVPMEMRPEFDLPPLPSPNQAHGVFQTRPPTTSNHFSGRAADINVSSAYRSAAEQAALWWRARDDKGRFQ